MRDQHGLGQTGNWGLSVPSWWHSPPIKRNPCHWGFPEFSKTLDNLIWHSVQPYFEEGWWWWCVDWRPSKVSSDLNDLWLYSCSTPKCWTGPECTKTSKWQDQPLTIFLCNSPRESLFLTPRSLAVFKVSSDLVQLGGVRPACCENSQLVGENSKDPHLGPPNIGSGLAFVLCLRCVVGMPCPGLCFVGPAWPWLPSLILGLPYHYKLAWWSLDCGWPWFLSLDQLCSSCPDTEGLYPLSVRPLPTLLSPWLSAHIFLQSSSLLLLPPQLHCGL